jgi:outer membrane protein OmpA-like peptidoglycan-associated protein
MKKNILRATTAVIACYIFCSHLSAQDTGDKIKVYNNYDFVPGDKILFEDHFNDDADGEFPSHWDLKGGQATLNKINGELAFCTTDGDAVVAPRMKNVKYLTDPFTLEYNFYVVPDANGFRVLLTGNTTDTHESNTSEVYLNYTGASFSNSNGISISKNFPVGLDNSDAFKNQWHHVAIACKNHQLKVYVDQFRVLVVPDTKVDYYSFSIASIGGSDKSPNIFKDIRVASGGGMYMIGKKFTDSRIVTHGINFDIDKANIKPESMGTLNMIVGVMKDNPDVNFEVGGHTDNTGETHHNLVLSQQRAEAVRSQLITMGIDGSRLTAKGYGDTKPVSDNSTPEGKANNRRVEFVRTNKS